MVRPHDGNDRSKFYLHNGLMSTIGQRIRESRKKAGLSGRWIPGDDAYCTYEMRQFEDWVYSDTGDRNLMNGSGQFLR